MFSNLKQTFNTPNTNFGFSSNVTPFGQSAFGKTPSTGFGTAAPAFGQQSTPLFGQASQHGSLFASAAPTNTFGQTVNTQPAFGSGMFGNASAQPSGSGLFGAANTSTFGQQNKSTGFGFGTNTANTGFGFGQSTNQVQPQQQTTGLFGQSTSNLFGQSSGFGTNTANNQVGTVLKFTPVTGTDTMVKGSINQTISTRHHCITCMKEYENKSLEELRWEDYQVNRKGPQQGAQPSGGLFGNMSQPVGAPLFGSGTVATSANTLFGQQDNKSVFGQPATATGGYVNCDLNNPPYPNDIHMTEVCPIPIPNPDTSVNVSYHIPPPGYPEIPPSTYQGNQMQNMNLSFPVPPPGFPPDISKTPDEGNQLKNTNLSFPVPPPGFPLDLSQVPDQGNQMQNTTLSFPVPPPGHPPDISQVPDQGNQMQNTNLSFPVPPPGFPPDICQLPEQANRMQNTNLSFPVPPPGYPPDISQVPDQGYQMQNTNLSFPVPPPGFPPDISQVPDQGNQTQNTNSSFPVPSPGFPLDLSQVPDQGNQMHDTNLSFLVPPPGYPPDISQVPDQGYQMQNTNLSFPVPPPDISQVPDQGNQTQNTNSSFPVPPPGFPLDLSQVPDQGNQMHDTNLSFRVPPPGYPPDISQFPDQGYQMQNTNLSFPVPPPGFPPDISQVPDQGNQTQNTNSSFPVPSPGFPLDLSQVPDQGNQMHDTNLSFLVPPPGYPPDISQVPDQGYQMQNTNLSFPVPPPDISQVPDQGNQTQNTNSSFPVPPPGFPLDLSQVPDQGNQMQNTTLSFPVPPPGHPPDISQVPDQGNQMQNTNLSFPVPPPGFPPDICQLPEQANRMQNMNLSFPVPPPGYPPDISQVSNQGNQMQNTNLSFPVPPPDIPQSPDQGNQTQNIYLSFPVPPPGFPPDTSQISDQDNRMQNMNLSFPVPPPGFPHDTSQIPNQDNRMQNTDLSFPIPPPGFLPYISQIPDQDNRIQNTNLSFPVPPPEFSTAPYQGFGASTPAFGATSAPNTGGGLFGKPLTGFGTATTSSAFPFSSTTQTNNLFGANNAAKPAFGVSSQPNSLFGQPTGFGQQSTFGSFGTTTNQNVGLFNQNKTTSFSIMPTSTTNTFGSFVTPAAQNTSSLFSGAKPPTQGFGGFGQTNTAPVFGQPNFGQTQQGGGLFNSSFNKTTTPLFGQTQATNTLGTGLQMGGSLTLFGSNVNKPNTMFGNNLGLFNSGFGANTNPGTFSLGGTLGQPGVPNQDQNQINTEQQIISMSSTPYGIPSLLNNINEVSSDLKDSTRPTNPSELKALLNTVAKPQITAPAEKLKPVQVFGRKVPMFDGLEHRDESLISNMRINSNPKRLIIRNHPSQNKDYLNDSLIRSSANTLILDTDLYSNNRSLEEDKPKEKENTSSLYPDLKSLQKEMSPAAQKSSKNSLNDISTTNNLPISSTMITSPSKALFLAESLNEDEISSPEEEEDLFTEASESQDWQIDHDTTRGVIKSGSTSELSARAEGANTSHPTGIILTRPEYYTVPSLDELVKFISEDGSCVVKGFTVGRYGYGNVYFSDAFDISNLNLDELVHFRHKEINIYPDESKKPPQGQGLNRRAQVTLDKVWPLDKKAKALVTDIDSLTKMDYAGRLRRLCEKQNTRFVEYRPDTGSWVFKVEHFSKYGLVDSEDELDNQAIPNGDQQKLIQETAKTFEESLDKTSSLSATTTDSVTTTPAAPFETVLIPSNVSLDLHDGVDFRTLDEGSMCNGLLDLETTYSNSRFNNYENEKCTLMKSTFFEQEMVDFDDASDVCSSDGGILELSNYVSKSSPKRKDTEYYDDLHTPESEYLPLDIFEDDDVPEPLDKPDIVPLDLLTDFTPTFVNNWDCLADMTLFKGKCFRVGWTKANTFLCLQKDEVPAEDSFPEPSYRTIAFKKLTNFNENAFQNLEKHLECQYEHSCKDEKNDIPHSVSFYGNAKLEKHQDIAKDLPKDNYEKQIWNLLATLFHYPEEDSNFIERNDIFKTKVDKTRKQELSEWIKLAVETAVENEVNNPERDDLSKILSYISGNKIEQAAELAMNSKNINLALLISQMPSSALSQISLKTQLSTWEKCDVFDFLDETVLKIYAILSGNTMVKTKRNTILVYEGMDWIRIFALYFWYVVKAQNPFSDAVHMYERMFEENKLAVAPLPDYEGVPENIYDLRFQLLKYYSDNGYPITHLFNTFTYTNDPLDYRLSWFVFQTLHSLNQELSSVRARNHMNISFATQLEQMGLWHWAVYVLTFIDNNIIKHDLIVDMIGRHVLIRDEETSEYLKREKMLIEKFKIKPELVEFAKGLKSQLTNKLKDAVYYYIYAGEWQRANKILMSTYAPENLLSYDYEHLIELLTPLSEHKELLPDWEEAGGLILDFAKLGVQYNNILALNDPIAIKRQLISFRSSVINVSVRFKFFKSLSYLHDVCVAEMSGRIAVMLRKLLTVINGHTYELCVDTAINAQTLPMTTDYLKQELNSILVDYLNGNQPQMIYL